MRSSVPMELLESIVDLMEDGVIIALPDGAIAYHNQVILDIFGVAKGAIESVGRYYAAAAFQ